MKVEISKPAVRTVKIEMTETEADALMLVLNRTIGMPLALRDLFTELADAGLKGSGYKVEGGELRLVNIRDDEW